MTQTKTGHRIIIITGKVPENERHEYPEPMPTQRTTGQRIVIIRNGEFVSSKRKRRAAVPRSS
jgi:hypothetical protein